MSGWGGGSLLNPESLLLCNETFPTGPPIFPPLVCKWSGRGVTVAGRSDLEGCGCVEYCPVDGLLKLNAELDDLMPPWL